MTAQDTIRFLHHQAANCRGRDEAEALCLLLPAILKVLQLPAMDDYEAAQFRRQLKSELAAVPFSKPSNRNFSSQLQPTK